MKNLKMIEKVVKDLCRKNGKIQIMRNINLDMNLEVTPVISIRVNNRLCFLISQCAYRSTNKMQVSLYYNFDDKDYENEDEKYKYQDFCLLTISDKGKIEFDYENNNCDINIEFDDKIIKKLIVIMKRLRKYVEPLVKMKNRF